MRNRGVLSSAQQHPDTMGKSGCDKAGISSFQARLFEINLLCEPGDQIALHFNPRFSSSRIVCNSFLNSVWGQEEVNNTFPFKAKEPFQVEIYSDQDYFHVFINENKVLQYKHRQKNLSSITKLQILDDVDISSVEITKRVVFQNNPLIPCTLFTFPTSSLENNISQTP
ncbi:Grifin [Turdus rufiventris]|nr:Grifin [Turdus rufiventris]